MPKPNSAIPVAILIRVSTTKQETRRQLNELTDYAASKGYQVVEVCTETVSGDAAEDKRQLQDIVELAAAGKIRKVLVHEISRIARRNSIAHRFVEELDSHGVSLYWHAQGIETLLSNGKRNPAAGIMLAVLAELGRAELETLRARIASGLADARRRGVRLGRRNGPVGWTKFYREKHRLDRIPSNIQFDNLPRSERKEATAYAHRTFLQNHKDIVKLLKAGQSVRNAAKIADKGISTVQRVKAAIAA